MSRLPGMEIPPTDAGSGVSPGEGGRVTGQHPHVIAAGPTDGGPSQPTVYRLGRCWLLSWACCALGDIAVLADGIQTYKHSNIQTFKHSNIQTFKHSNIQTFKHDTTVVCIAKGWCAKQGLLVFLASPRTLLHKVQISRCIGVLVLRKCRN